MIDNWSIHTSLHVIHMTSLSVDEMPLPRYVNWLTNFRGLPLLRGYGFLFKKTNYFFCVHLDSDAFWCLLALEISCMKILKKWKILHLAEKVEIKTSQIGLNINAKREKKMEKVNKGKEGKTIYIFMFYHMLLTTSSKPSTKMWLPPPRHNQM